MRFVSYHNPNPRAREHTVCVSQWGMRVFSLVTQFLWIRHEGLFWSIHQCTACRLYGATNGWDIGRSQKWHTSLLLCCAMEFFVLFFFWRSPRFFFHALCSVRSLSELKCSVLNPTDWCLWNQHCGSRTCTFFKILLMHNPFHVMYIYINFNYPFLNSSLNFVR